MSNQSSIYGRFVEGFITDDTGLAYAIILGFGALVIVAALWIILNDPFQMMLDAGAEHADGSEAKTSRDYLKTLWTAVPLVATVLVVFGWIVAASREGSI